MNKALQGDAAIVADSMDDDCTWQELLAALKAKFTVVSSLDVMMANLYGIKQGNNSVSQFAINIEKVLGSIRVSHPTTFSTRESQRHLRTRFFQGLNDRLRNSLRHKYETDCSYEELLQYARMVESEKSESGVNESIQAKATKAKASSAQQPKQQSQLKVTGDLVRLEKAYRSCQGELAKMQRHLQQMQEIKSSWDASAFQSSTDPTPPQNSGSGGNSSHSQPQNQNSSPQNSGQYPNQNQNYNSSGRGYRGRGRGRGYGPGKDKQQLHQVNLKVGTDFVSGAGILLPWMMPIILLKNALIIRKLERNGGNINNKLLDPSLLILHLKTPPLRETSKESI